jgi:hypothetical protein
MPLPDAPNTSPRVYNLLQNTDLENVTYANIASLGNPITAEELNEDELRRLVLVNLARLSVKSEWNGLLTAAGGADTLGELTDVSMDITDFVDSLLIQTNSNGSAPTTGTLSGATDNLGIGRDVFLALTSGDMNVGLGSLALNAVNSGVRNIAVGYGALMATESTTDNTAIGHFAAGGLGNGSSNTAVGASALAGVGSGSNNVAVGASALGKKTNGTANTACGANSLYNVLTATGNTGLGQFSGYTLTGEKNVVIGYEAGHTLTTADNCVIIGGVQADSITADDQLVIGAGDGGFFWIKGDDAGACYQGDNATAWSTTSDRRIKRDITDATKGLDAINAVQLRNFRYRQDNAYGLDPEPVRVGVIAQELEEVFPESIKENLNGHKTISTDSINWALVKAVQELSAKVEALESQA